MKRYKIFATALFALASVSLSANAQSPWESGGFKGYDEQPAAPSAAPTDSDTGAVGLQGFSLAPSSSIDNNAPVPGTAPAQAASQVMQGAPVAQMQSLPSSSKYASLIDAAVKNAIGQSGDISFVSIVQQSIDAVTKSSQLAEKNATPEMQKYAKQLLNIYTAIGNNIASIATANNIQSNITLQPVDISKLANLSGQNFDLAYMKSQRQQFQMLSSIFNTESKTGQNPALKAYAEKELPTINQQKDMIKQSYLASAKQNASAAASTSTPNTSSSTSTR